MAGAYFETQAEVPMPPAKGAKSRANASSIQQKPIWDLLRCKVPPR